jgi:hypothetical protein
MPSPCVNAPLHVKGDGSIEIQAVRTSAWPYPGAIGTYNGLAVDAGTGNGWAPPETGAAQSYEASVSTGPSDGGTNRTGAFTGVIASTASVTIANNDPNRAALCIFILTCDANFTVYGVTLTTVRFNLLINGAEYVGTSGNGDQSLFNSNAQGVVQTREFGFSYYYPLGAGASITFGANAHYSQSAIANSSTINLISMAARAYVVHN